MTVEVDRAQVLAHRHRALGLDRTATSVADLAVVDLGVQDTPPGSAALALATRLGRPTPLTDDEALAWSWRGSPHVHRRARLPEVAAAAWPRSERDALARLGQLGRQLAAEGASALGAFALAARALAEVVTGPMTKGEASAEVTRRLPAALHTDCGGCGSVHVGEMLFRSTALAAGLELLPGSPLRLAPIDGWRGAIPDPEGTDEAAAALRTCLGLLGPATTATAAAFLGTQRADAERLRSDALVEVLVDGAPAWIPDADLPHVLEAPPVVGVRLLPPGDPLLQSRDRELVVPEAAHRTVLWKAIGSPGALLVDGEVAGTWRPKRSGRRLTLTVTPFQPLRPGAGDALDEEAALVAEVRGAATVEVVVGG